MQLTVISPPGEAALSLASAKAFLRVGHDGEDALIQGLIDSATAALETATGLCLVQRTLRLSWSGWPASLRRLGVLTLRPGPVKQLVAVRLMDADDAPTEIMGRFGLHDGRLCLQGEASLPFMPAGGRFEVEVIAGFGGADEVPGDLQLALQTIVQAAYVRPVGGDGLPPVAGAIAASRREVRI